jgi:hypothetical protein
MKAAMSWAVLIASLAHAGIMGVPTNLNADGTTSTASVNPPAWLEVFGTAAIGSVGDSLHQTRYFVEVTGTTMDVRLFDPGASGARDFPGNNNTNTTFSLRTPAGAVLTTLTIGNDSALSDDRLLRLTPSGALAVPNSTTAANVSFSGLSPGIYEIRVTSSGGDEGNFYGLDVRVAKGDDTHYNVFTVGASSGVVSGLLTGQNTGTGAPVGAAIQPQTLFPYVTGGCSMFSSNFDGDSTVAAGLADALGNAPINLALSGDNAHVEASLLIETNAAQNLLIDNYGLWTLAFDPGSTNAIDWRFADFSGWATNTPAIPPDPVSGFRIYLPNGYNPVLGNANAVKPLKPKMTLGAAWVSGPNPPTTGSTTRFTLTGSTKNLSAAALTNAQITIGQPTGVSFVAGTQQCFVNGVSAACTDGSSAGFRRGTVASLPGGSTFSLRIDVTVTPAAAGLLNLSGVPVSTSTADNAWSQYTPNYGSVSEVLGPVCNAVVQVDGTTPVVTAATVEGIELQGQRLTFRTAMQSGTLGFRVYAAERADGLGRVLLTPALVNAQEPDTFEPREYAVALTSPLRSGFLFIEEYSLGAPPKIVATRSVEDSKTDSHFKAKPAQPEGSFKNVPSPERSSNVAPERLGSVKQLKIEVPAPGQVTITGAQLRAAGFSFEQRDARNPAWPVQTSEADRRNQGAVALFHNGVPVPFHWSERGLEFEAQAHRSQYTDRSVYVLSSKIPPKASVSFSGLESQDASVRHVERDLLYYAKSTWGQSPWFWSLLRSDVVWNSAASGSNFDLGELGQIQQPVKIRIHLVSRSGHRQLVEAWLNSVFVGEISFDGDQSVDLVAPFDRRNLRKTGNQLELKLRSVPDSPDDVGFGFVYFDALEIEGLPNISSGIVAISRVAEYSGAIPGLAGADYLILAPQIFMAEAERLVSAKKSLGIRAVAVDTERAYDRYSGGHVEARAIAALIAEAAKKGVKSVLLLGDDTFDYRNFTGRGALSLLPSLDGWDAQFGRVPSENRYADVDGDGLPDVAIGRLPAQTVGQLQLLVAKSLTGFDGAPDRHVAVVDARGPQDVDFQARAQVMSTLLGSTEIIDASQDPATVKNRIDMALRRGARSVHYFGHGSPTAWSSNAIWTSDDSARTQGAATSAVGFQWACFSQWYQYLYGPSLGESLLLMPQGGLRASFGPAGISDPEAQKKLSDFVYRGFFRGHLPLGESIRRAKRDALLQSDESAVRGVVESWNLLGDPSLVGSSFTGGTP